MDLKRSGLSIQSWEHDVGTWDASKIDKHPRITTRCRSRGIRQETEISTWGRAPLNGPATEFRSSQTPTASIMYGGAYGTINGLRFLTSRGRGGSAAQCSGMPFSRCLSSPLISHLDAGVLPKRHQSDIRTLSSLSMV